MGLFVRKHFYFLYQQILAVTQFYMILIMIFRSETIHCLVTVQRPYGLIDRYFSNYTASQPKRPIKLLCLWVAHITEEVKWQGNTEVTSGEDTAPADAATKICCEFFWTRFRSSRIRQYSVSMLWDLGMAGDPDKLLAFLTVTLHCCLSL